MTAPQPSASPTPLSDRILANVTRKALCSGDICISMHAGSIEFVVGDDEVLYRLGGSFQTVAELASFLGVDPSQIEDAR
jgi:hypothetical protein